MAQEDVFKKLVAHCKEYGFVFPSSDIYDGLGAVYDYGQNGVELKNNIKRYWWESMVRLHENIVGIDSAIFMHPTIWKASGHVDAFNDPLIDNKDSKKRYRADVLIEDQIAKYDEKIEKDVEKARKRFGEKFDEALFRETNPQIQEHIRKREALHERMSNALNANDLNEVRQIILDEKIVCPISGTCNWTEVRQFNLMFATEMGSTAEGASKIYLRPETAQGIFVNFLNVQKTGRMKVPFGIAQIGKAFRNEIVARQFISGCANSNRWKCNSLYAPVRNWNGLKNGKRPVCVGISSWDSGKKTIVFMITRSWPIMRMPLPISNSNSPSVSKKWKEFIPVRISTYHNINNIPVKRFNISIPN